MKSKFYNYLLLLSGAALLTGCPPSETETELNNQISFDGQLHNITSAGTDFDEALHLYFESGEDIETYFTLHLAQDEYRITESATFTFATDGKTGTFSEGGFSNKSTETAVNSGTIIIDVLEGDMYYIRVDCRCANGKDLTIRYFGTLKYEGPAGTTTFEVNGSKFPYAVAYISPSETDEDYGRYTEIEIDAFDFTNEGGFECYLTFFHSGESLAGTYTCKTDEPFGAGFVLGELEIELSGNETIVGVFSTGTVTIGIEGDIYTISFEGVKLDTLTGLIDVTGAYTGIMVSEPRPH